LLLTFYVSSRMTVTGVFIFWSAFPLYIGSVTLTLSTIHVDYLNLCLR
jgi:hypothetical protein